MPIRPENKARYPKEWKQISERVRQRAGNRCEGSPDFPTCRVPNHAWGWRDGSGSFHRVSKRTLRDTFSRDVRFTKRPPFVILSDNGPVKIIEIVLTVAHLDHTPENCADENLRAMCQRCHLNYDKGHHAATARRTRREGLAAADLFSSEVA